MAEVIEHLRVIFQNGSTPGFDFSIQDIGRGKYRLHRTGYCEVGVMEDTSDASIIKVMPKWKDKKIVLITRGVDPRVPSTNGSRSTKY